MDVVKIKDNFKNESFREFVNWLQADLSSVNKLILENLTNSSSLIADLSNHILKSLEKDNEEIYQQFLTLEKNGDGISQFGLYVDQTLQKLNISLN